MTNRSIYGPHNPHPLSQMRTELVWEGKYDEYGNVRGAINWSRTVPLQVTRPTSFVCADPYRSFDLPENQMLLALVERHHDDLGRVLGRWAGGGDRQDEAKGWRRELRRMQ